MKKIIFITLILSLFILAACSHNKESTQATVPTPDQSIITTDSSNKNNNVNSNSANNPTKEFNIIAKQWDFEPSAITVNVGDKVILNIENVDVKHGFNLPAFGINEDLDVGKITRIEFIADKIGEFPFYCSVYCGTGHGDMKGKLVVN